MSDTTHNNENTLRLGLVMAGAVSAGAYTGGVLDYLFQVLDKWEEKKKAHDRLTPTHNVRIDIISGASAGGMAGGMAVVAMQQPRNAVSPSRRGDEAYKQGNIFYDAWVNMLRGKDMLAELLTDKDIKQHGKLVSALNANFVKEIAAVQIKPERCDAKYMPPYVRKDMQLVLTLSNLEGFKYKLGFSGETEKYHCMTQYRDYAFFKLGDSYIEQNGRGDGRIPLNVCANIGVKELLQATPATGAFPVGLAYRMFERQAKYILDNPDLVYCDEKESDMKMSIEELKNLERTDIVTTYHVDGGMLNNEPFDMAMKIMAKQKISAAKNLALQEVDDKLLKPIEKNERAFDATIIMIDPFPSDDTIVQPGKEPSNKEFPFTLIQAIGKIFGSMRGQLLFKGEDIVAAFGKEDFSRFLISPRRRVPVSGGTTTEAIDGSKAIACGSLDGFGGFFDKRFREHDFYLGRSNCQSFLRKHFRITLSAKGGAPVNPIFAAGYSDPATVARYQFQDPEEVKKLGVNAPWYVPMIPDVLQYDEAYPDRDKPELPPDFPKYSMSQFDGYRDAVQDRIHSIAYEMLDGGLWTAFKAYYIFKKKAMFKSIRSIVEKNFKDWKMLK